MRARKKPITIDVEGPVTEPAAIHTLEGTMTADIGDYILTGIQGERYPCKPDIFHASYDIVED